MLILCHFYKPFCTITCYTTLVNTFNTQVLTLAVLKLTWNNHLEMCSHVEYKVLNYLYVCTYFAILYNRSNYENQLFLKHVSCYILVHLKTKLYSEHC